MQFVDPDGLDPIDISNPTKEQRKKVGLDAKRSSVGKTMYENKVSWHEDLKLKKPNKTVHSVGAREWSNLQLADNANYYTKAVFKVGAPNQLVDLWRARNDQPLTKLTIARAEGGMAAARIGVGNCGEHARMSFNLLASAKRTDPIALVKADRNDHMFVAIGDHREVSLEKIVFSDPWVTFPQAHLGAHGSYAIGAVTEWAPVGISGPAYQVDDNILARSESFNYPVKSGTKKSEDSAFLEIDEKKGIYSEWFSLRSDLVGLDYTWAVSGNFATFEKSYVKDRLDHYRRYLKVEQRLSQSTFN